MPAAAVRKLADSRAAPRALGGRSACRSRQRACRPARFRLLFVEETQAGQAQRRANAIIAARTAAAMAAMTSSCRENSAPTVPAAISTFRTVMTEVDQADGSGPAHWGRSTVAC